MDSNIERSHAPPVIAGMGPPLPHMKVVWHAFLPQQVAEVAIVVEERILVADGVARAQWNQRQPPTVGKDFTTTIYNAIKDGRLKSQRVLGHVALLRREVERWQPSATTGWPNGKRVSEEAKAQISASQKQRCAIRKANRNNAT